MGLTLDQTRRCNSPGNLHHKYQLGKLWEREGGERKEEEEEGEEKEGKEEERKEDERRI